MSKLSHQGKVYTMLKESIGSPVSVENLLAIEGVLAYKLSAYVLYAKIDFGAVIVPIRDGRKVVAYQMNDAGTGIPATQKRGRKAKAVSVAKPAAPVVVKSEVADVDQDPIENLRTSKVADIISDSVYEESPFEDQMFAEEFVRSL